MEKSNNLNRHEIAVEMANDFSATTINEMIEALALRIKWSQACGCSKRDVQVFTNAREALLALNDLAGGE